MKNPWIEYHPKTGSKPVGPRTEHIEVQLRGGAKGIVTIESLNWRELGNASVAKWRRV